jgi:uncharacterized damage-inducible protein DinB
MAINQMLLPEFDMEMAKTRTMLERVPEDKFGWRPHEKSMTMGRLAGHIAEMGSWAVPTIDKESLDVAPPGAPPYQPAVLNTRKDILDLFDKNRVEARAAIAKASDENLEKPWSLLMGGKTIFTMPRAAVLRSMVMNHIIHHRAQLGVYLRLNDVAVPGMYGPSADETKMM